MPRQRTPRRARRRLGCETLESRLLLSATALDLSGPRPVALAERLEGDGADKFTATVEPGWLDVRLSSGTPGLRLSLYASGRKLLDSIGVPGQGSAAHLRQFVVGPIDVRVEGPADTEYAITVSHLTAFDPL